MQVHVGQVGLCLAHQPQQEPGGRPVIAREPHAMRAQLVEEQAMQGEPHRVAEPLIGHRAGGGEVTCPQGTRGRQPLHRRQASSAMPTGHDTPVPPSPQ